MAAGTGFLLFFGITLALLGAVVVTGKRAQRRAHVPLVAGTVVALGVTIFFAERLGRELDLESAGVITPIHLTIAKLATLSFLLPLATGIRTLRRPETRRLHGRLAALAIALTVLAACTGTAMWLMAGPRVPEVPAGPASTSGAPVAASAGAHD